MTARTAHSTMTAPVPTMMEEVEEHYVLLHVFEFTSVTKKMGEQRGGIAQW